MKTATAEKLPDAIASIERAAPGPVFAPTGATKLIVKAGTTIHGEDLCIFGEDASVFLPELAIGADYYIRLVKGVPVASPAEGADLAGVVGGFHYAPGGNALARAGGDDAPAINSFSCWDLGWRPSCADPRGMTCVDGKFWSDIYLLGCNPHRDGTSRFGVTIADGDDVPMDETDESPYDSLDQPTAIKIFAMEGKQLLGIEEFFLAAFGVTEATSVGKDPRTTKLDAPRTSKWGVMQATGSMSTWGTDGDPDGPNRAYLLGGDWDGRDWAGSRFAYVEVWPDRSNVWLGARGRSDHLSPESPGSPLAVGSEVVEASASSAQPRQSRSTDPRRD